MIINPAEHPYSDVYKLLIGSIVPRPIGWISSRSADGVLNLAPYSFFSAVCSKPPIVLFSTVVRRDGSTKDSLANVKATKEFAVNIVSEELVERMNATSADVAPDVDEFALAGLTPVPCDLIGAPRVKEAKITMECSLVNVVTFGEGPGSGATAFGEVLRFHIEDSLFHNFRIDPDGLRAVGRMGGPTYVRTGDRFDLARPQ